MLPIGYYALRLVFDDGHTRGIFPFAYLRELDAAAHYDDVAGTVSDASRSSSLIGSTGLTRW